MISTRLFQVTVLGAACLAGGCQTTARNAPSATAASPSSDLTNPQNEFGDAVMQPFTDFNIMRDEIPAPLQSAVKSPYRKLDDTSCKAIVSKVAALDSALGPDLDASEGEQSRGAQMQSMAAGALKSLTTGWIPFRGVLRRLTGAEAHAKAAREAILAGAVRRAYLKGLGEREQCSPPASPLRKPVAP